jgi:hypothetical protein
MKLKTLIIVIVIVLLIVGVGFYFLAQRSTNTATPSGQTGSLPNTGNQQFPTSTGPGNGGTANSNPSPSSTHFGIVSNESILDYFIDAQNKTVVIEPDGEIKAITNGMASILSTSTFQNIASAAFSYDGKKILVSFASSTGPQTSIFDVAAKSWIKLPAGMQSPAWSPTDYQVAYLQSSSGRSETIYTVNAGNASVKPSVIGTVTAEDSMLQWLNKTTLILSDKPSVFTQGSVWFFNIPNQTLTAMAVEYPGLESAWSSTTSTFGLIFSSNAQNSGGHLSFVDAKGSQKTMAFTTLPSKCGFSLAISTSTTATSTTIKAPKIITTSSLSIYCAVPRDQQTLSIARLPDEYEQKILFTADDFYKINISDGVLSTIFNDQNQTFDATRLKVFNNTLFFVNRYDSKLYAISL